MSKHLKIKMNEKMDYKAIAEEVFKRLKPISKKLSEQYLNRRKSIIQEIDFKEGVARTRDYV